MLDPGLFVFGYPGGTPPKLPWMKNGSFMVFRRLHQLVPEFKQFLLSQAQALGMDPVLLGARLVGRWQSGAPLALTPTQDDTTLGNDPQQNNDFDFGDDPDQRRCPFGAHIRKTNPRKDIPKTALDPHRIIRAGIPFGEEVSDAESSTGKTQQDRGLLFVCYQTSIPQQFEFVQNSWANNPRFVSPIFPKQRPDGTGPVTVDFDPLIGQAKPPAVARTTDEPIPNYPTGNVRSTLNLAQAFIVPTGGGYFFIPSITAMTDELTS
jgi:Dyp-type peroxidase family